jgi:hypothetical protein
MTSLLSGTPITQEEQQKNDHHQPLMVMAVFAFLLVYIYLFTYASESLKLPMPQDMSESLGLQIEDVFDDDRNVDSSLYIPFTRVIESNDNERLVLFLGVGIAFLLVYFLPLKYKQRSLTGLFDSPSGLQFPYLDCVPTGVFWVLVLLSIYVFRAGAIYKMHFIGPYFCSGLSFFDSSIA